MKLPFLVKLVGKMVSQQVRRILEEIHYLDTGFRLRFIIESAFIVLMTSGRLG